MENSTLKHFSNYSKLTLTALFVWLCSFANAQSVMYGDTIFWENFGTGTTRSDISGRGTIGGLYMYAADLKYAIALNEGVLQTWMDGTTETLISGSPKFKEIPITTSSTMYTNKPASGAAGPFNGYWTITNWKDWTFSALTAGTLTTAFPAATFQAGAEDATNNYPCSWVKIDTDGNGTADTWKFGFYYAAFYYNETERVPNDGYYALINDGDSFTGADNYLQNHWLDHSGWSDLSTSPLDPATTAATHSGDGRFLFVNCSQSGTITGAVYKREVTELCRDAMFEFSIWVASIHGTSNASEFRIEIWSSDPGENPSLGSLTSASIGQTIAEANNARLISMNDRTAGILGQWQRIEEVFTLTGQDYCWVVVRNYGTGSGNDIAIDDLVFKPYAPFNLEIALAVNAQIVACSDGLVTLLSEFPPNANNPNPMPAYVDITQFGFYFQGERNGVWERIGSTIPIQTQSALEPLELTIPLSEYNLYTRFRVIVATTPAGFGGRCITFTYPPVNKEEIGDSPAFTLEGQDVCDDPLNVDDVNGKFVIRNTNQDKTGNACAGWQVKVRLPDGTIQTLSPAQKPTCP